MTRIRSRRKKKQPRDFVATCGAGLEKLVKEEIISFGGHGVETTPGAVKWQATTLASAYRACLWSRFSSRILLQLSRFEADDPEILYEEAGKIDWSRHFSGDTSFAVSCTLVNATLDHSHYASLKIKDAVVDQFRKRTGERPDVDVRKPGIRINLHVEGTSATLALDLSGESLHRRGYRAGAGEAPLKETLAAAIVHLSGIHTDMSVDYCLLDPMCGSATLLIEAALIVGDSAPGLLRDNFGFMHWHGHVPKMWDTLVAEALDREDQLTEGEWPTIIGYDADPQVVAVARKNIINAGLSDRIVVKQRQLARLHPPAAKGIMFSNPPYGERLSEKEAVKYLYRCLGRVFRNSFPGWQLGFFTANPDLADMLGVSWQERHRLYNGPIKCRMLTAVSTGGEEQQTHHWQVQETDPELPAADFSNRLRKNCLTLLPWARENKISCFRIYDADLPDFNLAIDLYEQWLHVHEYPPPPTIDRDKAKERFSQSLQVIRHLLAVPHSNLFIKTGQKQQRLASKEGGSGLGKLYEVHEGDCRFLVNFTDFVHTGLFAELRGVRALLAEQSNGRTFLNLFGYTGTATVAAAMGGATSTRTVDMSDKYLLQAQANLALNGFGGSLHRFSKADCTQWLQSCRERYGVIFIDPPALARHQKLFFDLQQDHVRLLQLAMERLSRDGVLVLTSDLRKFSLDPLLFEEFQVEEITDLVAAEDFKRNSRIHRCWSFRHREGGEQVNV
jgi:23S rRNA (guanine2445-N2)-methyltransferase / 23S rRNA (guanine2069-N7)-methyltransferase